MPELRHSQSVGRMAALIAGAIGVSGLAGAQETGGPAEPAAATSAVGHWTGTVDAGFQKLEIVIDLGLAGDGSWWGEIDIPSQGITDYAIADIVSEGSAISFRLPGVPGDPRFQGRLSDDGRAMSGTFTQNVMSFPFALDRQSDSPSTNPYGTEGYSLDRVQSTIGFSVRHFGISKVVGTFDRFDGACRFDESDPSACEVRVTIDATSINTRDEKRDRDLVKSGVLDVASHPEIAFRSTRIEKGDGAGAYVVVGDLSIRGVTREVVIPVVVAGPVRDPRGMLRIGVEGALTIDRRDYGMTFEDALETGELVVGNSVEIELHVEATRPLARPD